MYYKLQDFKPLIMQVLYEVGEGIV